MQTPNRFGLSRGAQRRANAASASPEDILHQDLGSKLLRMESVLAEKVVGCAVKPVRWCDHVVDGHHHCSRVGVGSRLVELASRLLDLLVDRVAEAVQVCQGMALCFEGSFSQTKERSRYVDRSDPNESHAGECGSGLKDGSKIYLYCVGGCNILLKTLTQVRCIL